MGADHNRGMNSVALEGALRLESLGLIRARGTDAASFLHGQLTNDILHLEPGQARLAGYCSAKGRLLASFVVWCAGDDLLLACSADLLALTLKRLRMFVLRAKCQLTDASAELPLYGLAGPAAQAWLGAAAPSEPWRVAERDSAWVVRLPDAAGLQRFLGAGLAPTPPLPALSAAAWAWLEVNSAVARIEQASSERFVPQMLNYEIVGGVDFRKGCYPGQEVVARSQYRGTIKRRSLLFEIDAPAPAVGTEVFHSEDPSQPAGQVVNAAPILDAHGASRSLALVEVKLAALALGSLHLASPAGTRLEATAMPYELPSEAVASA
jgi:tRNA-modifying protein YgfZ